VALDTNVLVFFVAAVFVLVILETKATSAVEYALTLDGELAKLARLIVTDDPPDALDTYVVGLRY
jgi:hypothetical protein